MSIQTVKTNGMLLLGGLCAVVLISSVTVSAQETETPTEPTVTTTATEPADTQKISERAAARKAALNTRLTAAQQRRVEARCKNAQTLMNTSVTKATSIEANRTKIHANVIEKLMNIESKASQQGIDTTALKAEITSLQTKITSFKTNASEYLQAAKDTAALDCVADPVAFKASLDTSRAALAKVKTDAVAIRAQLTDSVKPVLVTIKTQLAATENEAN